MQVTTTPNRMIVVVNKQNYTHDMIQRTKKFNVSCLSEEATFDVFRHFGFQSGKDTDKMPDGSYPRAENGIMYPVSYTHLDVYKRQALFESSVEESGYGSYRLIKSGC